jgi:hypothetical protein
LLVRAGVSVVAPAAVLVAALRVPRLASGAAAGSAVARTGLEGAAVLAAGAAGVTGAVGAGLSSAARWRARLWAAAAVALLTWGLWF